MELALTVAIGILLVAVSYAHDRIRNMQKELLIYKEKNAQAMNRLYGDRRFEIGYYGDLIDNNEKEYL